MSSLEQEAVNITVVRATKGIKYIFFIIFFLISLTGKSDEGFLY
jgi:hypothetical protein